MLRSFLGLLLVGLLGQAAPAPEEVAVPGSTTTFPSEVEARVTGQSVKLTLTGTALRLRRNTPMYALASYLGKGSEAHSAHELAQADCAKRFHLVMERPIDGKTLAQAFRTAVRLNHPEPKFDSEIRTLEQYMRNMSARKGEHLLMTHLPGIGLHIRVAGKVDFVIRSVAFSRAIWEIYLGENNVGEPIKKGLTSRL